MTPVEIAGAVLAKASAYDPRFRNPDAIILAAWTEALGDKIDADAALGAVAEHYRHETRSIMPADVLRLGRRREPEYYQPLAEKVAQIEQAHADDIAYQPELER